MSCRISDERIQGLSAGYESCPTRYEGRMMADEIIASRALVTELRALAERMRRFSCIDQTSQTEYINASCHATDEWLSELTSLLAAHDAQHDIQAVAAQATREGIIGIDFDAQQADQPNG